jgi:hypothetical protein
MTQSGRSKIGGSLIAITYKNRDTFISVVAWVLILYGLFKGYGWLSDLVLKMWLFSLDSFPPFMIAMVVMGLFFSMASLWCGIGLLRRQRSRLKALVVLLWLYIAWSFAQVAWSHFLFFKTGIPDLSDKMQYSLGLNISISIRVILESALIIWVIRQFSTALIQEEFEA